MQHDVQMTCSEPSWLSTLAMTLFTKASIGCELVAVLFALGALALLYLKARTHKPPHACTLHTPCTYRPPPPPPGKHSKACAGRDH
jgi:hypothetical protein